LELGIIDSRGSKKEKIGNEIAARGLQTVWMSPWVIKCSAGMQ
jgi:hypothetical protein